MGSRTEVPAMSHGVHKEAQRGNKNFALQMLRNGIRVTNADEMGTMRFRTAGSCSKEPDATQNKVGQLQLVRLQKLIGRIKRCEKKWSSRK